MSKTLPNWVNEFFDFKSGEAVNRVAYTESDAIFKSKVMKKMHELGMKLSIDKIGNICGFVGEPSDKTSVVIVSHTDSVINGGQFDGPAGVILGLAAIEELLEQKKQLEGNIKLIICATEESTRFNAACLGSKFLCGKLGEEKLAVMKDRNGVTMAEAIVEFYGFLDEHLGGIEVTKVPYVVGKDEVEQAVEVHIEQYESLHDAGEQIGVVTSVCAPYRVELQIKGRAGHTGSTPMDKRADAIFANSYFGVLLHEYVMKHAESIRATVTKQAQTNEPSMNTIAEGAVAWVDVRQQYPETAAKTEENINAIIAKVEELTNTKIEKTVLTADDPIAMTPQLIEKLFDTSNKLGLKTIKMPSWAGHDLPYIPAKQSGMVFIPSTGGSHSPREITTIQDMENGKNVLSAFLQEIL